ncbi:MAG: hypothetical protein M3256_15600, partial [Actinomycetota bacterium]|nr:hypothetical protein [Actinomycetota bacterium]
MIKVTMLEYRFVYPPKIPRGRVVVSLHNAGHVQHEFVLLKLPADFPPIDQQLHSSERRPLPTMYLVNAIDPGATRTFALDLSPGRYAILCGIHDPQDPETLTHALKGMNSEWR